MTLSAPVLKVRYKPFHNLPSSAITHGSVHPGGHCHATDQATSLPSGLNQLLGGGWTVTAEGQSHPMLEQGSLRYPYLLHADHLPHSDVQSGGRKLRLLSCSRVTAPHRLGSVTSLRCISHQGWYSRHPGPMGALALSRRCLFGLINMAYVNSTTHTQTHIPMHTCITI